MNTFQKAIRAVTIPLSATENILKAAVAAPTFPRYESFMDSFYPNSLYNYTKDVGDGHDSSVVMAPIKFISRTFPEAPLQVSKRADNDPIIDHPLITLLYNPNPYYTDVELWMATVIDWCIDGNAYWLKVKSKKDRGVKQLWWLPSHMVEPVWEPESNEFVSYYRYSPDGREVRYDAESIVHFRDGADPHNLRKGLSPLKSLFREIATDNEASQFAAIMLKNLGVPGVIIAPAATDRTIDATMAEANKLKFMETFGGDRRGEPMVMTAATDVHVLGFSPEQMNLRNLRRIPEERVSAIFGIPAIVAGLGAGLDRSTFANYSEAREAAYESTIIPMQRLFGSKVRQQLLKEFEPDVSSFQITFDNSRVRVLQEDENKRSERIGQQVTSGIRKLSEARIDLGLDTGPHEDVYLRPMAVVEVRAEDVGKEPPEIPAPQALNPSGDTTPPEEEEVDEDSDSGDTA